ncbi:MAG: dehydratase [Acidimicrobiia bacterium]|nr:dehydratase [Acidimicrobiia bacterium]
MPDRPRYSEVEVGDSGPELEVGPLTRTDFVRYAGASGDFNPMHHDEVFATSAGLPSVFGHGMFTAGILSRAVAEWVGVENVRGCSARFTERIWPDDVLEVKITVTGKDDAERRIEMDCRVERESKVILSGTASAVLPA